MNNLSERIADARGAAAAQEGDIRLKGLISAMTIDAGPATGDPTHVSVHTHYRAWTRYFPAEDLEMLRAQDDDELANTIVSWIQCAIESGMLSISNPPTAYRKPGALAEFGAGAGLRPPNAA